MNRPALDEREERQRDWIIQTFARKARRRLRKRRIVNILIGYLR